MYLFHNDLNVSFNFKNYYLIAFLIRFKLVSIYIFAFNAFVMNFTPKF